MIVVCLKNFPEKYYFTEYICLRSKENKYLGPGCCLDRNTPPSLSIARSVCQDPEADHWCQNAEYLIFFCALLKNLWKARFSIPPLPRIFLEVRFINFA